MPEAESAGEVLLRYIETLFRAVDQRQPMRVVWLLGDALAVHLPREVFEEALALSRAPADSFRAPVHLLRYHHRTVQLLSGGAPAEPLAGNGNDEDQLAFAFVRSEPQRSDDEPVLD